ncbi:MAG: Murein DD-endopeptidase MepM [Pseudomonadota bacterium]|jgi:murein DD-endopeptidase MepM/ murein hydrolase activator NlpD
MQLMWVSGPTGRVRKISITLRTVSIAIGIFAAFLIAMGGILHFVGLRIAIEARPEIARAMGGVLTQAEQDKIEDSYKERLQLIQEKLQSTTDEIVQIQKLKDRFMEMATPSAVKSQIPGGNAKGGPLKLVTAKKNNDADLISALDESLQDVSSFKKSVEEINALWAKQLAWLNTLPTGTPVKGGYNLSSGYGLRIDPFTQAMAKHEGLDFAAPVGTPIIASANGVISRAGWDSQYGNVVEVNHAEGFKTRYAHASQLLVRTGQTVKKGDVIAKVGNTGRSSGPHLHYEVIRAGAHINPANMMPRPH